MKNYLYIFLLFSACASPQEEEYKPPKKASTTHTPLYQSGDCLSFKIDSGKVIVGIVLDLSEDDGGLWYGICFTNYIDTVVPTISTIKSHHLNGRKIHSTVDAKGFFVGLDFDYLADSCMRSIGDTVRYVGNLRLNSTKIEMGAQSATDNYSQFISLYKIGRERRRYPPDDYGDTFNEHFRPDEYFPVRNFLYY